MKKLVICEKVCIWGSCGAFALLKTKQYVLLSNDDHNNVYKSLLMVGA